MGVFRNSLPLFGIQVLSSSVTGKWFGACKPGQKHGSVTLAGMPGGKFRTHPEMMKRMQQMQQSTGR